MFIEGVSRSLLGSCCLVALLLASACSSSSSAEAGGDAGLASGEVSCTTDPRVDSYSAGLAKDGSQGLLSFRLVDSEPGPPAKGANTFALQVDDASGAPADVTLRVDLKMPDHGHGSSIVPTINFDADNQSFTISPLYLFMPGVWRIDFSAYGNGSASETLLDDASFFFCIEG